MEQRADTVERAHPVVHRIPLRTRRWILAGLLVVTAAITLGPFPVGLFDVVHGAARAVVSWLPGDADGRPTRKQTEAVLNVLIPMLLVLAVAAGWPRVRPLRLFAGAVLATLFVEGVQAVLPGRYSELADVVLNGTGALLGTLIVQTARRRAGRGGQTPSAGSAERV